MSGRAGSHRSVPPLPAAVHALGRDAAEAERLRRPSTEPQPHAVALLDRAGPDGRVMGVDVDPVHLALARAFVRERGLTNVEIREGDARRTGLPPSSFDLIHARSLLITIPDPAAVVAEMVRLVGPGGWVAGMEPDMAVYLYHPPHPARDRLHEIFVAAFRVDGADPFIGRRIGAVPRGRSHRGRGRGARRSLPARALAADHPSGPGAQYAARDRRAGDRR